MGDGLRAGEERGALVRREGREEEVEARVRVVEEVRRVVELRDGARVHREDHVAVDDRLEAVRDGQARRPDEGVLEHALHGGVRVLVDVRRRLVHDDELRPPEQRARDAQQLLLPRRQGAAVGLDDVVQRQRAEPRGVERAPLVRRPVLLEGVQVPVDGPAQQHVVLGHHGHALPQGAEPDEGHVQPVDEHPARLGLDQAEHERDEARFARARAADDADPRAALDVQIQVLQRRRQARPVA